MLQLLEARTEKEPLHIIKSLRHVKSDIGHDFALQMAWECLDERYSTDHTPSQKFITFINYSFQKSSKNSKTDNLLTKIKTQIVPPREC